MWLKSVSQSLSCFLGRFDSRSDGVRIFMGESLLVDLQKVSGSTQIFDWVLMVSCVYGPTSNYYNIQCTI